jgi:hypothetical protein
MTQAWKNKAGSKTGKEQRVKLRASGGTIRCADAVQDYTWRSGHEDGCEQMQKSIPRCGKTGVNPCAI